MAFRYLSPLRQLIGGHNEIYKSAYVKQLIITASQQLIFCILKHQNAFVNLVQSEQKTFWAKLYNFSSKGLNGKIGLTGWDSFLINSVFYFDSLIYHSSFVDPSSACLLVFIIVFFIRCISMNTPKLNCYFLCTFLTALGPFFIISQSSLVYITPLNLLASANFINVLFASTYRSLMKIE